MSGKLKAIAAALVAIAAMSAIAAQAASAANHEFTSEVSTTYLTGEQIGQHVFSIGTAGVEVECETVVFTGEQSGKEADKVRMTPSYGGHCTLAGIELTFTNKADREYEFDSDTTDGEDATVRLDCNDNTEGIVISGPACTIYIGDTQRRSQRQPEPQRRELPQRSRPDPRRRHGDSDSRRNHIRVERVPLPTARPARDRA